MPSHRPSGQALVTGAIPSPRRYMPHFNRARVQHSHGSSICTDCRQFGLSVFGVSRFYESQDVELRIFAAFVWIIEDADRKWAIGCLFISLMLIVGNNAGFVERYDLAISSGLRAMISTRRPRLGTTRRPVLCWLCAQPSEPMPRDRVDAL